MSNQRSCERVNADFDAELRPLGESYWWPGSVADIGERGVRIFTPGGPRLLPGTGVWLRIQPKDLVSKLVVRGSVVRCEATAAQDGVQLACEFA